MNSVKAMRGALVAIEQDLISAYADEVFRAYWTHLKDISRDEILAGIVEAVGMDTDDFFKKISDQKYKDRLRGNTDELIARGGFGSPTVFLDGNDMYFGNDRLVLLEHKLAS